jgi:arylsulfatase A
VPNWPPYAWRENERLIGNPTAQMKQGTMVGVSVGPAVADWDFSAVLLEYGKRCAEYVRGRKTKKQPFFLYFPMPSPHTPIARAASSRASPASAPTLIFSSNPTGPWAKLMKALDETGQADNTVVFFTCDNGTSPKANFPQLDAAGVHLNANWRGWKADAYEGGHRVPFIVR